MNRIKTLTALILAVAAVMFMDISVFAKVIQGYEGNGTEAYPYIVNTYDELKTLINDKYASGYIALGSDLETTAADLQVIRVSNHVTIDLAGHWIKRTGVCVDRSIFLITSSTANDTLLTINDSIGTGGISAKTNHGNNAAYIFELTASDMNAWLVINGGTYESNDRMLLVYGGNLVINSGKFTSEYTCILAEYNYKRIILNGGEFRTTGARDNEVLEAPYTTSVYSRDIILRNFTAYGTLDCRYGVSPADGTKVYIDGVETNVSGTKVEGNEIKYISETVTKITKQPVQLETNNGRIDAEIEASGADSYKWYIIDDDDIARDFEYAQNAGWCDIVSKSDKSARLCISPKNKEIDGKRVVCYVTNDKCTIISDVIRVEIPKPVITTQPASEIITKIGSSAIFTVKGRNFGNVTWHAVDKNNSAVDISTLEHGHSTSSTQASVTIDIDSPLLNGYSVYCTIEGNGYSVDSDSTRVKILYFTSQPESVVECAEDDVITLSVTAENAESYEWFIADANLGQPYSWSSMGMAEADAKSPTLTLTVTDSMYDTDVWCIIRNGDLYAKSEYIHIEMTDSEMPHWLKQLDSKIDVLTGGTVVLEVKAAFAGGYNWRFEDKNGNLVNIEELCTVYHPAENKYIFENVPKSMSGLKIMVWASSDIGGTTDECTARLGVYDELWLDTTYANSEMTVFYGDELKLYCWETADRYVWRVSYSPKSGGETRVIEEEIPYEIEYIDCFDDEWRDAILPTNNVKVTVYADGYKCNDITLNIIYKQGDMDGNGKIEQNDAALYLKHLSGVQPFTDEQLARADINYDGEHDMLDVILILGDL